MPEVWKQIGAEPEHVTYENAAKFGVLPVNVTVHKGNMLFPRIDAEKEIEELNQIIAQNQPAPAYQPEPLADQIQIEDFAKIDLRVAKILQAEKVKKSKKLLKLQLDDGMGGRQVVSGIAEYYKPEDLIGKKIILIANLKPVKLCGVESCGMICASDLPDGSIAVQFVDDQFPCGAKLK